MKPLSDLRHWLTRRRLYRMPTWRYCFSIESVEIPEMYKLDRFVINTGNTITATASVRLIQTK